MDEQNLAPAEAESPDTEPEQPTKGWLERTWDFFASVPVATVLIFIIAAASVTGTLIEQEGQYSSWQPPADYYPARYGPTMGSFLFKTGMTRMYGSWWFMTLLFMLGASLVICSLERFVPLWRAVQRPNTKPEAAFVKHLKNRFEYRPDKGVAAAIAPLFAALKSRRYFVVQEGDRLYADKGRWGRWGPYITHIGLLLILAGAMMRAIPGFYSDQFVWVRDGATVKVPGADWYVNNEKFTVEYYENGQPKSYKTLATVIDDGREVARQEISMNQPLWHDWVELYQSSYRQELGKIQVGFNERATGKAIGQVTMDLAALDPSYTMAGYRIDVKEYYPDFGLDGNGKPTTKSGDANNPGIVMDVTPPGGGKTFTVWYFVMYPEMEFDPNTPVQLKTLDMGVSSTTGLKVKKDLGVPVIYLGLLIVSLGVFATFYIAHRRYWALVEGGRVVVGGWTNRNLGSLRNEIEVLATALDPKTNPRKDPMEGEER
jgi:cytochrome c biogenesis protein